MKSCNSAGALVTKRFYYIEICFKQRTITGSQHIVLVKEKDFSLQGNILKVGDEEK